MIVFNRDKEKTLKFGLDIKGINSKMLEYYIRLSSDTADFGFKGNLNEDNILEFTIPALGGIIKESEIEGLKSVKIEVHDKENKYYLKPMEDDMKFDEAPRAVTEKKDEKDTKKDININLKIEEELDDDKPAPKSKISRFLK